MKKDLKNPARKLSRRHTTLKSSQTSLSSFGKMPPATDASQQPKPALVMKQQEKADPKELGPPALQQTLSKDKANDEDRRKSFKNEDAVDQSSTDKNKENEEVGDGSNAAGVGQL